MPPFVRVVDRLSTICAAVAAVLLAAAALVITWSVIYRALGASTFWEIEFAVYMMVTALFLGSPYCLGTRGHVGVDLLAHYVPERYARLLEISVMLIGLGVCLFLAIAGGILTVESFAKGERTESMWAPLKWPLFLAMPLGLGLTALQYVAELVRPPADTAERR